MSAVEFETRLRESFDSTLREASQFFMGSGDLRKTMRRLAKRLSAEGISYAILGGMALGEHGYVRMTDDVDVLVDGQGLRRFVGALVGRGYVRAFRGAKRVFRDVETGVRIEFLVAHEFPGDGKPKAVSFPDPSAHVVEAGGIRFLDLPRLVELKLASGMSAPDRLRDLADVQELIRVDKLDEAFARKLDSSVRDRFVELVRSVARSRHDRSG